MSLFCRGHGSPREACAGELGQQQCLRLREKKCALFLDPEEEQGITKTCFLEVAKKIGA